MTTFADVGTDVIRVASVPENHVYVRHLSPVDGDGGVRRLADPRPCHAPSDQSVWWPPVMLDPAWIEANHASFDLFHLHFGFDAQTVENLDDVVATLHRHGKPLVQTVHDLRNPHHADPAAHDAHLDVLIPAADHLVTLTPGAAEVIGRRWGRTAQVLPHPHVVEPSGLETPRRPRAEVVVGVHLKSLRANMASRPVLEVLAAAVAELPGVVLRVDVHPDVLEPGNRHHDGDLARWLQDADRHGRLRLAVHHFFSDDELWHYLRDEIDVSVLPYRFGTHSGWLEACHDLGTTVVAPSCGFYAQQRPCLIYRNDEEHGLDAASLTAAVVTATGRDRPHWRAVRAQRMAERRAVAAAHRAAYAAVLP
ncbi:glycosyltransferase family 1 protein [Pseudonocardia sp. CA-107938]|uniref:glycosyltransferase family 1 protein n=1 Tax=Pseudonocardia sp. CA-107938 TaxID=3240021 RepID=UPI003D90FB02